MEILYYRKDLFESTAEQKNFKAKYGYDLAPPVTWQQFTDAAEFFTRGICPLWDRCKSRCRDRVPGYRTPSGLSRRSPG